MSDYFILDDNSMYTMLDDYQRSRGDCYAMYADLNDVMYDEKFFVNLQYLSTLPLLMDKEKPFCEVFTNSSSAFTKVKKKINKYKDKWVAARIKTGLILCDIELDLPFMVALLIFDFTRVNPGQIYITRQQFKELEYIRLGKHSRTFACIECSCLRDNHTWDVRNTKYEELVEHEHSEQHERARNTKTMEIDL